MSARSRSRARLALAAAAAAALATGVAVVGLAAPAAATEVVLAFDFGQVLPGDVLEQRAPFEVAMDATVASVALDAPIDPAFGALDMAVCSTALGCVPVAALAGRSLDAGAYELVATLTASDDLESGSLEVVGGRISLVERGAALAATGSILAPTGIVAAVVLGALGLALVMTRRRTGERT